MVLAFYGARHSEAALRQLLRTRGMGTSPARVMIELPRLGFQASVLDGSLDLLTEHLKTGQPCIVHVWTEHLGYWHDAVVHALVVTALADTGVIVNDPILDHGQHIIPLDEFMRAWRAVDRLLLLIQPI